MVVKRDVIDINILWKYLLEERVRYSGLKIKLSFRPLGGYRREEDYRINLTFFKCCITLRSRKLSAWCSLHWDLCCWLEWRRDSSRSFDNWILRELIIDATATPSSHILLPLVRYLFPIKILSSALVHYFYSALPHLIFFSSPFNRCLNAWHVTATPVPMEPLLPRKLTTDKDNQKMASLLEINRSCLGEEINSQVVSRKSPSSASRFLYCASPEATAPS